MVPTCRLALLVLVAGTACAPGSGDARRAAVTRPIVGGLADPNHPAVGAVILGSGLCTGVVIAPRVVLTAAHCITKGGGPVGFVLGPSAFGPQLDIAQRLSHPDYAAHDENGVTVAWHDVGALVLASPAPVEPLPWLAELPVALKGASVTLVGFGQGLTEPAGDKRVVSVVIDDVWTHGFWNHPTAQAPGNSCEGDSGAPVLFALNGVESVAGIVSSGDVQCQSGSYGSRLDVDADFIAGVLALVAEGSEPGAEVGDGVTEGAAEADPAAETEAPADGSPDASLDETRDAAALDRAEAIPFDDPGDATELQERDATADSGCTASPVRSAGLGAAMAGLFLVMLLGFRRVRRNDPAG